VVEAAAPVVVAEVAAPPAPVPTPVPTPAPPFSSPFGEGNSSGSNSDSNSSGTTANENNAWGAPPTSNAANENNAWGAPPTPNAASGNAWGAPPVSNAPSTSPVSAGNNAWGAPSVTGGVSSSSSGGQQFAGFNAAAAAALATPDEDDEVGASETEVGFNGGRRGSLRNRILLLALAPILALGLILLVFLFLRVPESSNSLIRESANLLALSVGGAYDASLPSLAIRRIEPLTKQESTLFIAIEDKGGGNNFFIASQLDTATTEKLKADTTAFMDGLKGKTSGSWSWSSGKQNYALEIKKQGFSVNGDDQQPTENLEEASYTVTVGLVANKSAQIRDGLLGFTLLVIVVVLGIAVFLAITITRSLTEPILALVSSANKISLGKLDDPVLHEGNDEIGELGTALERMRVSLFESMERLRKRRR
jgi:HAMP domain-containing protein